MNHDRDQIMMVTCNPVMTEASSLGFVKNIIHLPDGKWNVSLTPDADEALIYGDECEVLINWLNDGTDIVIVDIDPTFVCQFSRMHKKILHHS
jgi:hypothetical protein